MTSLNISPPKRKKIAEGVEKYEGELTNETYVKRIAPFVRFLKSKKELLILYGGAGSGKTVAINQKIAEKFIKEDDIDILITRRTTPSLKIPKAPWPLMWSTLNSWGVKGVKRHKVNLTLKYNNNQILFKGIDDPEKIKSSEYDYIWAEEATDFTEDEFEMIMLRLGRDQSTANPQMYASFNPISSYHWLIQNYINKPNSPDYDIMHSDHRMNRHLSMKYRRRLERLKLKNKNLWQIYARGKPGVLSNIIFTNWSIGNAPSRPPDRGGMDFGTSDPRVLLSIWRDENKAYIHEEFYRTGTTNNDMISWLTSERKWPLEIPIYADPQRKDSIQDISDAGYLIYKANNAVKDGIDYVAGLDLVISPESVHIIKEIQSYVRRKDKDGNVREEPVKFKDHAMDAMRYGLFTERDENDTTLPDPDSNEGQSQMPVFYKSKGIPHM